MMMRVSGTASLVSSLDLWFVQPGPGHHSASAGGSHGDPAVDNIDSR